MRQSVGRRVIQALTCAAVLGVSLAVPAPKTAHANDPVRLYVFAGQSNMVGKDTMASELPLISPSAAVAPPGVLFWGPVADFPTMWGPLKAPTEILQPRRHQGFGPEIGAAPLLARRHPGSTIAVVKFASSGTSLYRDWRPGIKGGLYERMIARVRRASEQLRGGKDAPIRIAGFFWMQGESDSERLQAAKAYEANLASFVRAVRRDLDSPSLPFVIGMITDLRRESRAHFQYSDVVRRGQGNVVKSVPNAYLVSTDDLERSPEEHVHFSSRGTFDLGRRFVKADFPL
jgi:hypothetical protein